ncbi:peptidyl-tRNA hydrolase domain-containing protein 1 [Spiromyces aspiralis]|uniref:Peptidyl-tRNA hydrolase domain-containing protein 1 n=1 Tax=Spiromyces aspiralis TaxID=68401 RepID=A0ACC1HUA8_9FUNG|nr:peptidyl-tRNA hydrolase domain-containing protein 1 [Spiromyces aspiralis]
MARRKVKNEAALLSISESLTNINIPHHLWVEQPENIPTCLATVPILRSELGDALKKCTLMK